jgi:SNF2 family DNA or RNA helicase
VVIVSYHLLHEDRQLLEAEDWDVVVLDEAQFIKNPSALRAQAAFALKARVRIAATGTPVENHLGDLWSIFHFLNADLLGSFRDFQVHFLKPVQRDGDHVARQQLRQMVRPLLLRRTSSSTSTYPTANRISCSR